ncbi:hypothetical protein FMEXI_4241 [Fusarium mexicanum]|uniref:Uncharacterized protein n=1 Tax=Fusarium mexicanum TaxID=751941 RepID=A0A8H5J664_9HYPO|nr:hypothetical protein FMEXI_4241 [Fusarium mexicanum]
MSSSQLSDVEVEVVTLDLAINICHLSSFTFLRGPRVSEKTQQLLHGPITALSFQLKINTSLNTFIPHETNEPLIPRGAKSGTVLDLLRLLSEVTAFEAYIQTNDLPDSVLDRIICIVDNQPPNIQPRPNRSTDSLPGNQAKAVSFHDEGQSPPLYEASSHIIPRNELTSNVSGKRLRVSQGPDAPSDIVTIMEDLRLQIAELRQRRRDGHADITGLKSDVAQHKAQALVTEMKLCELEKERQKNNDKIVKIDKDI